MKCIKNYIAVLLIIITTLTAGGCALNVPVADSGATVDEADATRVYIGKSKTEMKAGEYSVFTVVATTTELDAQPVYEWVSSDTEVATVDSRGRVDALKEGKVTISAVATKAKVDYELTVIPSEEEPLSLTTARTGNSKTLTKNIESENDMKLYALLVNARNNTVVAYTYNPKKNSEGEHIYNVAVREMVCSLSATNRIKQDTEYAVESKERWFQDDYGWCYQYSTQFSSGMRFCSAPYSEKAAASLLYEEYNKLGTNCTDGDVWLSCADAQWIYENCDEGTLVMVKTSSEDPLGVPEPLILSEDSVSTSWDPTDSSEKNPYKNAKPYFTGIEDVKVKLGEEFNPLAGVLAFDTCSNSTANNIEVDGTVPVDKAGTYVISYYYTDDLHRTVRHDRRITVE